MLCPLLAAGTEASVTMPAAPACLEEDCAWWLKMPRQCAILRLALELEELRRRPGGGRHKAIQQH
jgi:hypothetical protein